MRELSSNELQVVAGGDANAKFAEAALLALGDAGAIGTIAAAVINNANEIGEIVDAWIYQDIIDSDINETVYVFGHAS